MWKVSKKVSKVNYEVFGALKKPVFTGFVLSSTTIFVLFSQSTWIKNLLCLAPLDFIKPLNLLNIFHLASQCFTQFKWQTVSKTVSKFGCYIFCYNSLSTLSINLFKYLYHINNAFFPNISIISYSPIYN